jgi:hypothetical protein
MLSEIRKPLDEYAPSEQAPLAGYGAAMLAYGIALSLALSLVRRTRTRPGWADVALLGVGTHKLSRLITKDFVTAPLRAPFTRRKENEGAGEVHDEPRGGAVSKTIGKLLTCPYCLGFWISTGLNTLLMLRPAETRFVLRMLATDTISDFLHVSYSGLNETRKKSSAERQLAERTTRASLTSP